MQATRLNNIVNSNSCQSQSLQLVAAGQEAGLYEQVFLLTKYGFSTQKVMDFLLKMLVCISSRSRGSRLPLMRGTSVGEASQKAATTLITVTPTGASGTVASAARCLVTSGSLGRPHVWSARRQSTSTAAPSHACQVLRSCRDLSVGQPGRKTQLPTQTPSR